MITFILKILELYICFFLTAGSIIQVKVQFAEIIILLGCLTIMGPAVRVTWKIFRKNKLVRNFMLKYLPNFNRRLSSLHKSQTRQKMAGYTEKFLRSRRRSQQRYHKLACATRLFFHWTKEEKINYLYLNTYCDEITMEHSRNSRNKY